MEDGALVDALDPRTHHICFPLRLAATSVRPTSTSCSCCGATSLITSASGDRYRGRGLAGWDEAQQVNRFVLHVCEGSSSCRHDLSPHMQRS